MENFYYAQLDAEHFCVGLSQLSGEVTAENMIRIETYDINLLGLKYDVEAGEWTDERRPEPEEPTVSHDDEIRDELMKELISKGIPFYTIYLGAEIPTFITDFVNKTSENNTSIKVYLCEQSKGAEL